MLRCPGVKPGAWSALPYPFIVPYTMGTVVGRYSECDSLIQRGEGDHDGVLPQHHQLHLLIHLQIKKPVLSRPLLLLSPDPPTHHKAQNLSWLGTDGTVKPF